MKNYISQQQVKIYFVRKKNTIYGVLFIHCEQWIHGENKTELKVKLTNSPTFE